MTKRILDVDIEKFVAVEEEMVAFGEPNGGVDLFVAGGDAVDIGESLLNVLDLAESFLAFELLEKSHSFCEV